MNDRAWQEESDAADDSLEEEEAKGKSESKVLNRIQATKEGHVRHGCYLFRNEVVGISSDITESAVKTKGECCKLDKRYSFVIAFM